MTTDFCAWFSANNLSSDSCSPPIDAEPTGSDNDEEEEQDDLELDMDDKLTLLTNDQSNQTTAEHDATCDIPPINSLVHDILLRPVELVNVCAWDQFSLYEKVRKRKGRNIAPVSVQEDSDKSEGEDECDESRLGNGGML